MAIVAVLLPQDKNLFRSCGYSAWGGAAKNIGGATANKGYEPQAVIGSYLQKYVYPDWFAAHQKRGQELPEAHAHFTDGAARCLQLRGEYLFVAEGEGGFRVYDVANIANKGVSQRITTAPFSPLGQDAHIASRNATCMALPTNQAIAPQRNQGELMRGANHEQAFHPIYHYAFVVDAVEGLIVVNVDTFADGEPRNNFLKRALTWDDGNILKGARHIVLGGYYAYI